jgi:hypothetical protein
MDIKKVIMVVSSSLVFGTALFVYFNSGRVFTPSAPFTPVSCKANRPADLLLKESDNGVLKKLAEYEAVCKGAVVDELMTFTAMPQTEAEAATAAKQMAGTLHAFADHNIPPLVLFEPSLTSPIALADIHKGAYNNVLMRYYQELENQGISDKEMGTWVLFPEANTPTWATTDPDDFAKNVAKVGRFQKNVFPNSKLSILLNSRSYPSHDADWSHGELKSLTPYLNKIPAGLVDRFGYQGFPSVAEADASHQYRQLEASDFLPTHLAKEAVEILGIKNIWLNTGTFSRMYADQPASEVQLKASERHKILQGILKQATTLASNFDVSVNLFAENKSLMNEHVDWSYWQIGHANESPDKNVFVWFVHQVRINRMGFSLYDYM